MAAMLLAQSCNTQSEQSQPDRGTRGEMGETARWKHHGKKKMEADQEGEAGCDGGGRWTWKERRGSGIIINIQFVLTLNLSNFGVHFALMLLVCGLWNEKTWT